jgi:hypothetical protein
VRFLQVLVALVLLVVLTALPSLAQSPNGTINGLVLDPSNRVIAGADILAINDVTGMKYSSQTNDLGIYVVANLPPGPYRLQVSKIGFKTLVKPDIVLNVQDALSINFTLPIGATFETLTVEGGAPLVNTESAAVSTVVDRQFAENLPMNGRSFQTLIQLTPGVVLTPSTADTSGQFSVNGQRAASNYWMVDGVSGNIGVGVNAGAIPGNGFAGTLGSFSAQGGTNSLVSVDAMQEFRVQTSTYAPEFGRTPGGQVSIVTRSGTNQFHGTASDYVRNDIFDASDWFNGFTNNPPLPKAEERQNDFGGTFGGPIVKDKTFFFFSYEGLRLRLPQTLLTTVPDLSARQNALPALQPYLNAFPLPNGADDVNSGIAQLNASFSNSSSLNAYSIRVDHRLSHTANVFGRYNYAPSESVQRGAAQSPLSDLEPIKIGTQTATVGATLTISPVTANDFRLNYSRTIGSGYFYLDNFAGAAPLSSLPLPVPFSSRDALFQFSIFSLSNRSLSVGSTVRNIQRQVNAIDNLLLQRGTHTLKFGVDYRRLSPSYGPRAYSQFAVFADVPSAEGGNPAFSEVTSQRNATLLFRNLGLFAQDTWRVVPRLTLTYGLRLDIDTAPTSLEGPALPAVTGYNLSDLTGLSLARPGTLPFSTTFNNIAPRLGVAYQITDSADWGLVLRGGVGVFYDLVTSEVGNAFSLNYPFAASAFVGGSFPLDPASSGPPPITTASLATPPGTLYAFDPYLKLPYTLEWNLALEQALGKQQALTASYIGAAGRRLLQPADILFPNDNFAAVNLMGNTATSDYDALQLQFLRRLSRGVQALAAYTWSHSLDDGSAGSFGNNANTFVPAVNAKANRGASDFDIRNAFSVGLTYDLPAPKKGAVLRSFTHGWSLESVFQARSVPPVNVYYSLIGQQFQQLLNAGTLVRPDVVPGVAVYLHGSQYPGSVALNPAAFTSPPTDSNGNPTRQGNLPRNASRGFGLAQWDFAVHREITIHESLRLQVRAELFNLLNHPNFAPPVGDLLSPQFLNPQFGQSTQMLGRYLGGANLGGGGFSPLYQIGGPRSAQFALKLLF